MNTNPNTFTSELSNALAATGENYIAETVNLGEYGTSCTITKHGSTRKLYIMPIEDDLIDLALYDETGNTIANGTLFAKTATDVTPEELTTLVELCF